MSRSSVNRRRFIRAAGTGATAITLAGCRKRADPDGAVAGKGAGKGPLSGKTIKIGSLAPAPESWHVGKGVEKGAILAAEQITQSGGLPFKTPGVLGADVQIRTGNTNLSPATGRKEYYRLVRKEGCHATTGIFFP